MTTITIPATTAPVVRSADDAPPTWFLNGLMTTLATRDETGGVFTLMEHTLTAACNPPVHIHRVEDESFYVLEGEIEFEVDGEVALARPGTFAYVPRGSVHSFRVRSDVARTLVIATRDAPGGGLHAFFEAAGEPAARRELPTPTAPDPEALGSLGDGQARNHDRRTTGVTDPGRLMVVVAHPDDESFGCGSVLAHAAHLGHDTIVVSATRGEAGDHEPAGVGPGGIARVREQELRSAARILGVARVVVLDHVDSGMSGEAAPDSLVAVPPDALAAEIRVLIDEVRPDVVVTIDASDGHRDHVAIRDATVEAARTSLHRPNATYLSCLLRSAMNRWADHLRDVNRWDDYTALSNLGTPEEAITTVIDVRAHLGTRWEAIRAHCSQVSPFEALPTELADLFLATDHLVRLDPPWPGGDPETELGPFSG